MALQNPINLSFFEFFIELTLNNHKSWFDINRTRYEKHVREPFIELCEQIIGRMSEFDATFAELEPKKCIFRINKDIRFSKDKTPYKTHYAASFHVGGRMKMWPGGIYLELGPEGCGIYSGVYMPEKEDLPKFRQNIANRIPDFQNAINAPDFIRFFGQVQGEKNKILPSELREAAVREPLIFNKQFYVGHRFEAEKALEQDFVEYVIQVWQAASEFNRILGGFN